MAKTMKKLLAFVLAAIMVLSMIPAVSATETEQTTPTRGAALGASKTYEAEKWIEVDTAAELKAALKNGGGASASANADIVVGVRLLADITYTAEVAAKSSGTHLYFGYYKDATDTEPSKSRPQTVVLDLNGHTLTAAEDLKGSRLFGAYGGSTVTITNGTIIQNGAYTAYAPGVFFNGDCKLTIDGVTWIMNDASERATYGGMFHLATSAQSLTVINSDITKNGGSVYRGGIVNTSGGATITLQNSTFTGGKAVGKGDDYFARGGQFYVADKANMTAENCAFIGGVCESADNDYIQGGNILKYGDEGTVTLTDCIVSGGSAKNGGNIAIVSSGKVVLNNTTVSGGNSTTSSGNIYIASGSVTVNGTSSIADGTAPKGGNFSIAGGAVHLNDNATVSGGVSTAEGGSIYMTGGTLNLNDNATVSGGQSPTKGGNIYATAATVNMNDNAVVENGQVINTGNVLTYGGNICVDGGTDKKTTTLNINGGIVRDGYVETVSSANSTYVGGGNLAAFNAAKINLNAGQILGGKVMNKETTQGLSMGGSIYVGGDSEFKMYAGSTVSGGFCDSAKASSNRGGNIGYTGATVRIYGGLIENGKADRAGNLFAPSTGAKLYIYEGAVIKDGRATNSYGGNMSFNGKVYIYGGLISGGYASATYGESVYVANHKMAELHVYGGVIDSTVNNAVYTASGSAATLKLYSVVLGDETNAAYIADCSTMSKVGSEYHVIHNDVEGATTIVEPTCTEAGSKTINCMVCGPDSDTAREYVYAIPATGHTAGEPVTENEVANSCTAEGSYDTVVYCTVCSAELSRETTTVAAAGHTAGAPVVENEVAGTCSADGSYDTVVYCTVCEAEISRETTTVAAAGHTPGEAVKENEVANSCTADGSYDTVVYCTVCEAEISRETTTVAAAGHTAGAPVVEKEVANSCTTDGSYDTVVYCTVCSSEISRETTTIAATGHNYDAAVTAPTCENGGYTTYTCGTCGDTYNADETAALGHTYEGTYTAPTFEADGFTTYVCATCGDTYVEAHEGSKLTAVATADGVSYQTIQEALTAGGEIVLLQDVVAADKLAVTNATLNLNGYTLTLADVNDNYGLIVKGAVTIEGEGEIIATGTYGIGVSATGDLTVLGGNFTAEAINDYILGNWGTTVIKGGTFCGIYNCVNNFAGTTEIYGGTFTTAEFDYTGEYESADILADAGLTVYGGIYSKPVEEAYCAELVYPKANDDGTYTVVGAASFAGDPQNVTAKVGETVQFTAVATGDIIAYRWEYSRDGITWYNTKMEGVNTDTLTVPVLLSRDGYRYRCVITDAYGNGATSAPAMLTVEQPAEFVQITQQPAAQTAFAGESAIFAVEATGEGLTYQWQYSKNGANWYYTGMTGAKTAQLTVDATLARDGYQYRCVITDAYGTAVTTDAAALTVNEKNVTVTGPESQIATSGTVVFTVDVEGEGLTYCWQYQRADGTKWFNTTMEGYNTNTLTVVVTAARNGYKYRCVITDAAGNETVSGEATLTVGQPLVITGPQDQVGKNGEATFTVTVEGEVKSFQWQYSKNGTTWSNVTSSDGFGANTASVWLDATTNRNGYQYRCVIIDMLGNEYITEAATLTVK